MLIAAGANVEAKNNVSGTEYGIRRREAMQDKRRRNDFASTEVGEVKGGRVTQQAFEVADKKDSGISDAAMPGTRGDGRKDAQENAPL